MRIKLDENLPAELVEDLAAAGHQVDSVESEGLAGEPDRVVVEAARRGRRVLFTLDKGIADMRRFPPHRHHGIVLFRLRRRGRAAVRRVVLGALPQIDAEPRIPGKLMVVTEASVRLRH